MSAPDDLTRMQHMRDACRAGLRVADGKTRESLESDETTVLALCRAIEIIGEAGSKVSKSTREAYPQIPWAEIVAMHNRLIHAYFDVDLDQVWKAVTEDIPPLVAQLEAILASETDDNSGSA